MHMKDKSYRQSHPERAVRPAAGSSSSPSSHPEFQKPPFSRPFRISELPEQSPELGFSVEIKASNEECEALAEDFGLPGIDRLDAAFQIFRLNGGCFRVTGFADADVREICVVSLEPFDSRIKAPIDVDFAELPKSGTNKGRVTQTGSDPGLVMRLDGEQEPPEPIIDGKIDLGAIACEFLALNLDPYPKKPGAVFEPLAGTAEEAGEISPFEVLKKLKDGQ